MTPHQVRVVQAETEAAVARKRLTGSIAALQERLKPAVLVRDIRRELVEARGSAVDVTIRYPGAVAISGAGVALLLMARPLWRLVRRRAEPAATPDISDR